MLDQTSQSDYRRSSNLQHRKNSLRRSQTGPRDANRDLIGRIWKDTQLITLTYLAANHHLERPSFALMTNGDDLVFVKLAQAEELQYNFSRAFAALASHQELQHILQGLKQLDRVVAS